MKHILNYFVTLLSVCACLTSCTKLDSEESQTVYVEWLETGQIDTLSAPHIALTSYGAMICIRGERSIWRAGSMWEYCYQSANIQITRSEKEST